MVTPAVNQLHTFHSQDREVFSKLVLNFSRPPAESLLVMATWLWLEDFGFEDIFPFILALSDPLIVALANEAVLIFQILDSKNPPNGFGQIPLTATFMTKEISLQIIYNHRYSAIVGIKNFLTTVCSRVFSDILQKVLPSPSSSSPSSGSSRIRQPLIIPGFPHPTFGSINVMPNVVSGDNPPINNLFREPNSLWLWNSNSIATENDRTMFITFSRGFPVAQEDVRELFTREFGENCVEGIYMQDDNENNPNRIVNSNDHHQSLYARMVLDSVTTVDRILNGESVRKFRIHGKHIWARKYENRYVPT